MKKKEQGYQSSWHRLKDRYHLSVVNKSLLVEVYSRDISKGRLMAAVSLIGIMIVSFTYCLIAFTPLKSIIIPGHETEETRMELFALQAEVIKLQQQVNGKISYSMKLDSNLTKFGIPVDSINNMNLKTATFGSGCFWCTEAIFELVDGVEDVISGYSAGNTENPTCLLYTSPSPRD